jgi:hypothetical protein
MNATCWGFAAAGLVVGAAAAWFLRPAAVAPAPAPTRDVDLVDGKYLVLRNDYGHWVYERVEGGGFKVVVKEMTPRGLETIWGLQSEHKPMAIATPKGEIVYVPFTRYSTETGSFSTDHKFFQMTDAGLVEVPLTLAPQAR